MKKIILFFSLSPSRFSAFLRLCGLFFLFASNVFAQENLPDEFRGYKIYKAKISVQTEASDEKAKKADAIIYPGEIEPSDVSISGAEFEISPEIRTLKQSGRVDFLVFRDFRVNGLPVEIEEYKNPFDFQKNQVLKLPQPMRIRLSLTQTMRGAWREWRDSRLFWQVTGRVFVFGRFNKAGLKFKRVVPVDINLQIKNPIKSNR